MQKEHLLYVSVLLCIQLQNFLMNALIFFDMRKLDEYTGAPFGKQ